MRSSITFNSHNIEKIPRNLKMRHHSDPKPLISFVRRCLKVVQYDYIECSCALVAVITYPTGIRWFTLTLCIGRRVGGLIWRRWCESNEQSRCRTTGDMASTQGDDPRPAASARLRAAASAADAGSATEWNHGRIVHDYNADRRSLHGRRTGLRRADSDLRLFREIWGLTYAIGVADRAGGGGGKPVERGEGRGEVFPGPATFGGRHRSKTLKNGVPDGFFLTWNVHKIHFRPPLGELTTLPKVPEGTRLPMFHPSPRLQRLDLGAYRMR